MSLFQPHLLVQYLLSADFFHGAIMTLSLSIASLATGMVVGLLLAVGQEVPLRPVRWLVVFYLWLFRGTPVLLQLVFAFNVLPAFGVLLPGFACAVLALGLNEAPTWQRSCAPAFAPWGRGSGSPHARWGWRNGA